MDPSGRALRLAYRQKRKKIEVRLRQFRLLRQASERALFEELCFCLLTPQSQAKICDLIIQEISRNGLVHQGTEEVLRPYIKRARFYRKKTAYLVGARGVFIKQGWYALKDFLERGDEHSARQWLVDNIKGLGYKEASHFLRNIGYGKRLAILDIHILRRLKEYGVIDVIPSSLNKKTYCQIEKRMSGFARSLEIPMAHLDLLFWSMATGEIFK